MMNTMKNVGHMLKHHELVKLFFIREQYYNFAFSFHLTKKLRKIFLNLDP